MGGADSVEYRKEVKKEQISWIYNAPPGLKKQIERERKKVEEEQRKKEWQQAMQSMSREERRFAEKEMENGLSVHERNVRRFDFLKNAPMAAEYVKNMEVTHKPFGKLIRNVRCIKCGKWGHRIYDRECEMNKYNPLNVEVKDEKKEKTEQNKADPLYRMNSKLLTKHLERYENEDDECMDVKSVDKMTTITTADAQSVFTLNPNENAVNAKVFHVKSFEGNDGTQFDLIGDEQNEQSAENGIVEKKKKRKSKKRKRRDVDDMDEDLKYIQSLDKDKQIKLLKEIEKREKKRRKRKKKKKRRKYSDDSSVDSDEDRYTRKRKKSKRHRSRSRSRSRSRDRHRHKNHSRRSYS